MTPLKPLGYKYRNIGRGNILVRYVSMITRDKDGGQTIWMQQQMDEE